MASKTIGTKFFPVRKDIQNFVVDWVKYLKKEKPFNDDDPIFPRAEYEYNELEDVFFTENISRDQIQSTTTLRTILKKASEKIGIPYYNPHSYRHRLAFNG